MCSGAVATALLLESLSFCTFELSAGVAAVAGDGVRLGCLEECKGLLVGDKVAEGGVDVSGARPRPKAGENTPALLDGTVLLR